MADIVIVQGAPLLIATVGVPSGVPSSRRVIAGAGLTGGGTLDDDITLDVVPDPDGSIIVEGNSIKLGIIATDAQHGSRGGGDLHDDVVALGNSGFMSGADKDRLDGMADNAVAADSDVVWTGTHLFEGASFDVGASFGVDPATGKVGINPTGTPHFYEALTIENGNIIMQGAGETAWINKLVGTFGLHVNPSFAAGRMFLDTPTGAIEWRLVYNEDGDTERHVFVVESTGTIASVRDDDLGSHFEGWRKNGDTVPLFRLNSYPTMTLEMGPGGDTATDLAWRRLGAGSGRMLNPGTDALASLDLARAYSSAAAPVVLGATASTSHSLNGSDVLVGGKLEVDGAAFLDSTLVAASTVDVRGRVLNSTAALNLGASASTGHSLGASDVLVGGVLEVDGLSYFDAAVNLAAQANWSGVLPGTNRKFLEYTPPNGPGKYSFLVNNADNPGNIAGDGRQDHVLIIGWNVARGGGVESSSDMGFGWHIESHWDDGGGFAVLEHHWKYIKADGSATHAPMSMNIRKDTYFTQGRFGFDQLYFGPNGPDSGGPWVMYGSGIFEGGTGAIVRKVGLGSWLYQYNGAGVYEPLVNLESVAEGIVIGGQTFAGVKMGVPLGAGRALFIYGNDCDATGNQSGGNLTIGGGRGRGTGTSGAVVFATAAAGSSGSSQNALTERWRISTSGRLQDAAGGGLVGYTTSAADPSTTELPVDKAWGIHKNTNSGNVFLAYRDGASVVKVQLT